MQKPECETLNQEQESFYMVWLIKVSLKDAT